MSPIVWVIPHPVTASGTYVKFGRVRPPDKQGAHRGKCSSTTRARTAIHCTSGTYVKSYAHLSPSCLELSLTDVR